MNNYKNLAEEKFNSALKFALKNDLIREFLFWYIGRKVYQHMEYLRDKPFQVNKDKFLIFRALLNSLDKVFKKGTISEATLDKISKVFVRRIIARDLKDKQKLRQRVGFNPPLFITISPTNVCNLRCKGCYAGRIYKKNTLDYDVFNWILNEVKKLGLRFVVLSGGEPFSYQSKGKTIFDILKKHDDMFFMAYTNGTFITKEVAEKLGKLGNFTPAISVEGFEKETDYRRGNGIHKKVLQAMKNLREAGVIFGISVTPTKYNADLLVSKKFFDYYFKGQGAFYGWYFQYMPIGKDPDLNLMVTPQQRIRMRQKIWQAVEDYKILISDFWNSATASNGCVSAARDGGYFYILWTGEITPCVFIPFKDKNNKVNNVYSLYKNKLSIVDAINAPLLKSIRKWQENYWLGKSGEQCGNLLVPCPIRDHSEQFIGIAKKFAIPIDEGAKDYLKLVENGGLPYYNHECATLTEPIWKERYLKEEIKIVH